MTTHLLGPGRCKGCGATVFWNGKRWREAGRRKGAHACPSDRLLCGGFMPNIRERCARRPGHADCHRSRWDMDNALERRRKWNRAA